MDLYIGPPRHRHRRRFFLAIVILLVVGLIIWRRHTWQSPDQALTDLKQDVQHVFNYASLPLQVTHPETGVEAVMLLTSTVVQNPGSAAYTADLYSPTKREHKIPWPNAGGRTRVQTYTVQLDDTLWSIATQFELDLETLRWSNPELERNPDLLPVGSTLRILPVLGVYHIVSKGDTVKSIAAKYGVTEDAITHYPPNALYPPYDLIAGQGIIVPYGRKN